MAKARNRLADQQGLGKRGKFDDHAANTGAPEYPHELKFGNVSPADPELQAQMAEILKASPLVPLIGIDAPEKFEEMIKAGLEATEGTEFTPCIEILLRTSDEEALNVGLDKITDLKDKYGGRVNILIGSVLNAKDVALASEAGVDGIVSGGYNRNIHAATKASRLPYLPAFHGENEVQQAINAGFTVIKSFPAKAADAEAAIKAMKAPLSRLDVTIRTSADEAGAEDAFHVQTPSQVLAAVADDEDVVFLDPLVLSDEKTTEIDALLKANNVEICCTGGVSQDNLLEFARRRPVIGVGASYLGKTEDLVGDWGGGLIAWYDAKSNLRPATRVEPTFKPSDPGDGQG